MESYKITDTQTGSCRSRLDVRSIALSQTLAQARGRQQNAPRAYRILVKHHHVTTGTLLKPDNRSGDNYKNTPQVQTRVVESPASSRPEIRARPDIDLPVYSHKTPTCTLFLRLLLTLKFELQFPVQSHSHIPHAFLDGRGHSRQGQQRFLYAVWRHLLMSVPEALV